MQIFEKFSSKSSCEEIVIAISSCILFVYLHFPLPFSNLFYVNHCLMKSEGKEKAQSFALEKGITEYQKIEFDSRNKIQGSYKVKMKKLYLG